MFRTLLTVAIARARQEAQEEGDDHESDARQHEASIAVPGSPRPDRDRDHEDRELELVARLHGFRSLGAYRRTASRNAFVNRASTLVCAASESPTSNVDPSRS